MYVNLHRYYETIQVNKHVTQFEVVQIFNKNVKELNFYKYN